MRLFHCRYTITVRDVLQTFACDVLQVRYDKKVGPETAVKFMTDGILLRELQADLLLRAYSVLILDEAHERSLNTDLLLGITYAPYLGYSAVHDKFHKASNASKSQRHRLIFRGSERRSLWEPYVKLDWCTLPLAAIQNTVKIADVQSMAFGCRAAFKSGAAAQADGCRAAGRVAAQAHNHERDAAS